MIRLCDGKNREERWTGRVYLPEGDVRKVPTSEPI